MTTKRQVSPHHRMGGGYSKATTSASVHAVFVHCSSCPWDGMRMNADDPCVRCGGHVIVGSRAAARAHRRERQRSLGQFGVRCPEEEARTNAALRAAREEAQR